VIYLLDVSVLLALGYQDHKFHTRATRWLVGAGAVDTALSLATCSITELGFVRIASGGAGFAKDTSGAQKDLRALKEQWPFVFFDDGLDANHLPAWVARSKQVTDGHLLQLAKHHAATFATLDEGIPGALLIPEDIAPPPGVREQHVAYGAAA
jgi:predicted nucleic acid-binding protein